MRRDIQKLAQQIRAFEVDESKLWAVLPGVANSAGNLALHVEGNLREYVGRQLGGVAYQRQRPREFSDRDIPVSELAVRIDKLAEVVATAVAALDAGALDRAYPENVLGVELTTGQFVIHLHGHLNYHLGQIDYLRRILLLEAKPVDYVRL